MFVYVCIVCVIIPNALLALRAYMDKWWNPFSRGQAPWWGWLYSPAGEHRWFCDILWIIGLELQAFIRLQVCFGFAFAAITQRWCSQSCNSHGQEPPPFRLALLLFFLSISTHIGVGKSWMWRHVTNGTTLSCQTWQMFDEMGKIDAGSFWSNRMAGVLLINPVWNR